MDGEARAGKGIAGGGRMFRYVQVRGRREEEERKRREKRKKRMV
jgi:hypothetical protein